MKLPVLVLELRVGGAGVDEGLILENVVPHVHKS